MIVVMILMTLMSWFSILKDSDHGLPAISHPPKISRWLKIVIDDDPGVLGAANQILICVKRFEMKDQKLLNNISLRNPLTRILYLKKKLLLNII